MAQKPLSQAGRFCQSDDESDNASLNENNGDNAEDGGDSRISQIVIERSETVVAEGDLAEDLPPSDKPQLVRVKRRLILSPSLQVSGSRLAPHDSWELMPNLSKELLSESDSDKEDASYPFSDPFPSDSNERGGFPFESEGGYLQTPPSTCSELNRSPQSATWRLDSSPGNDQPPSAQCWLKSTPARRAAEEGCAAPALKSPMPRWSPAAPPQSPVEMAQFAFPRSDGRPKPHALASPYGELRGRANQDSEPGGAKGALADCPSMQTPSCYRPRSSQLWGGGVKQMPYGASPLSSSARSYLADGGMFSAGLGSDSYDIDPDAAAGGLRPVPPPGDRQLPPARSSPGPMLPSAGRGLGAPRIPARSPVGRQGPFTPPIGPRPGYQDNVCHGSFWDSESLPERAGMVRPMSQGRGIARGAPRPRPSTDPPTPPATPPPPRFAPNAQFRDQSPSRSGFQMGPAKEHRSPYYSNESVASLNYTQEPQAMQRNVYSAPPQRQRPGMMARTTTLFQGRPMQSECLSSPRVSNTQVSSMYDPHMPTLKQPLTSAQPPVVRRTSPSGWNERTMPQNVPQPRQENKKFVQRMETARVQALPQPQLRYASREGDWPPSQTRFRLSRSPSPTPAPAPAAATPAAAAASAAAPADPPLAKAIPPPSSWSLQHSPEDNVSPRSSRRRFSESPRQPASAASLKSQRANEAVPTSLLVEMVTASSQTPPCSVYYPCSNFQDALKATGSTGMDLSQPFVEIVRSLPWESVTSVRRLEEIFITEPAGLHHEIIDISTTSSSDRPAPAPVTASASSHAGCPSIHTVTSTTIVTDPPTSSKHAVVSFHSTSDSMHTAREDASTHSASDPTRTPRDSTSKHALAAARPARPCASKHAVAPIHSTSDSLHAVVSIHSATDSMHTAKSRNSSASPERAADGAEAAPKTSSTLPDVADVPGDKRGPPPSNKKKCECANDDGITPCLKRKEKNLPLSTEERKEETKATAEGDIPESKVPTASSRSSACNPCSSCKTKPGAAAARKTAKDALSSGDPQPPFDESGTASLRQLFNTCKSGPSFLSFDIGTASEGFSKHPYMKNSGSLEIRCTNHEKQKTPPARRSNCVHHKGDGNLSPPCRGRRLRVGVGHKTTGA